MKAVFEKYHCMGNDYLVYDPNKNEMELGPEQVKAVCDRNFGIGSDGILVGPMLGGEKMYVRILNPDGSEAEKSGNGMGIFARYLKDACGLPVEETVLLNLPVLSISDFLLITKS